MPNLINEFYVKVNGFVIPAEKIRKKFAKRLKRLREKNPERNINPSQKEKIGYEVINQLIDRRLLLDFGKDQGLSPSKEEVEAEIMRLRESKENLYDLDHVSDNVYELLSDKLTIRNVIEKNKVSWNDKENEERLKAYYEDHKRNFSRGEAVKVRHIFINYKETDDENETTLLMTQNILGRLLDGEEFSRLAGEFSDCPSRDHGGELGYVLRGVTDKVFEDMVFTLNPGELSDVFETGRGYHIAEVMEYQEDYCPPFDSVKDNLRETLDRLVYRETRERVVSALKETADIEYIEG